MLNNLNEIYEDSFDYYGFPRIPVIEEIFDTLVEQGWEITSGGYFDIDNIAYQFGKEALFRKIFDKNRN